MIDLPADNRKPDAAVPPASCDLCGLPVPSREIQLARPPHTYRFCCMGCRQVFQLLLEAHGAAAPLSFRNTEVFRICRDLGLIPAPAAPSHPTAVEEVAAGIDCRPQDRDRHRQQAGATLDVVIRVAGMWCPACAWVIEHTLKRLPGIHGAWCSFSSDLLRCEYDPAATSPRDVIAHINRMGYAASAFGEQPRGGAARRELLRLGVSIFLTANVMMLSFGLYSGFLVDLGPREIMGISWMLFALAAAVLAYGGQGILRRAWSGLLHLRFGMEALVALGAIAAFTYSTWNLAAASIHLYYDTSAMLITLVLIGKYLESAAKAGVQTHLATLFSLWPAKVRVWEADNPAGRYVPVAELARGQLFLVEPGEVVAADAVVLRGVGAVDEAKLTGEPRPVKKRPGDRVMSGATIVHGVLTLQAEAVGEKSTLGQMLAVLQRAVAQKAGLEAGTDRILQWFVPAVVILAASTCLGGVTAGLSLNEALIRAVTVLVISCPCALGIAVPLARVAGISLAGKEGILVHDFSSFEVASKIGTFVFDKTGTITAGQWSLVEIVECGCLSPEQMLAIAASMEKDCDHVVAAAILREASRRQIPKVAVDKREIFPNGVSGLLGGVRVKIGSAAFLAQELRRTALAPKYSKNPTDSVVYLGYDGKVCGIFVFGDRLKPGAKAAIDRLHSAGFQVLLVSGDGAETTAEVARQVNIAEAYGDRLPHEKAHLVAALQREGRKVAVVGDGINDAAALLQADLALALHSNGGLGRQAAHATMMRGEVEQVWTFMELAGRVRKKIYQNLFFSALYNMGGIPVAMSGLLTPLAAVVAMFLSSLSVIGNTLLLLRRPQPAPAAAK